MVSVARFVCRPGAGIVSSAVFHSATVGAEIKVNQTAFVMGEVTITELM